MEGNSKAMASQAGDPPALQDVLQLVGFQVGSEEFALDILRVQEIIRLQELTRVPNSPDFVAGVINLRGRVIPVVSLRKRFALQERPPDSRARIVVVEDKGNVLGLMVDSVSEVLRTPVATVKPLPRMGKNEPEYVSGVCNLDDRLLVLLDVEQLMSHTNEVQAQSSST